MYFASSHNRLHTFVFLSSFDTERNSVWDNSVFYGPTERDIKTSDFCLCITPQHIFFLLHDLVICQHRLHCNTI